MRNMHGTRIFAPVGQGAFYVEHINGLSFVYDCGTSSKKCCLTNQVDWIFSKGEPIEAVFVSHMHADHIDGLPYLLKRCHVKRIYFPLLTGAQRLLSLCRLAKDWSWLCKVPNDEVQPFGVFSLVTTPLEAVRELNSETEVYFVEPLEFESTAWNERDETAIDDMQHYGNANTYSDPSGCSSRGGVKSGVAVSLSSLPEWHLIPVNVKYHVRVERLLESLRQMSFGARTVQEACSSVGDVFRSGNSDDIRRIKKAYQAVDANMNSHTMTLYSGPSIDDDICQRNVSAWSLAGCVWAASRLPASLPGGCLYLGDFQAGDDAYWNEVLRVYERFWNKIGCIQIPHHGAKSNFRDEFVDCARVSIMSAGDTGQHPNGGVLKRYIRAGILPHIVTEQLFSGAQFEIY